MQVPRQHPEKGRRRRLWMGNVSLTGSLLDPKLTRSYSPQPHRGPIERLWNWTQLRCSTSARSGPGRAYDGAGAYDFAQARRLHRHPIVGQVLAGRTQRSFVERRQPNTGGAMATTRVVSSAPLAMVDPYSQCLYPNELHCRQRLSSQVEPIASIAEGGELLWKQHYPSQQTR